MTERPGDTVSVLGLRARGRHGVLPEEAVLGQEFVVDVTLHLDTADAAAGDDLDRTVDYGSLAAEVVAVVVGPSVALVETLAQRVADVCLARARVDRVDVTVHKPQAPIQVPFDDVVVRISRARRPRRVVLSLGSNLGDRLQALELALARLEASGLPVEMVSPVYETDPVGGPQQDAYLNAVAVVRTGLSLPSVLARTQAVEALGGRIRDVRWGPRTIDVDIVAAGEETLLDPVCLVPHPRAHGRVFVLAPWSDVDPGATIPGHGPVAELLQTLDRMGVRRRDDLRLEVGR